MSYSKKNALLVFLLVGNLLYSQNSLIGDGFGGRLWYSPTNYSVGSYSAYSICFDGSGSNQLYGWGNDGAGQLGGTGSSEFPVEIDLMDDVRYFSAGYIMGAIKNDDSGWVWGFSLAPSMPHSVISDVVFVDASADNISFVKNDGTVWSLGANGLGSFGTGSLSGASNVPVQMLNITNAVRVANNVSTTIVLLADSTLMAVGTGSLGLGAAVPLTYTPMPILGLDNVIDIKSNTSATLALTSDGHVYFWGDNAVLGESYLPIKIDTLDNVIAISGCDDGEHFLVLDDEGVCWTLGGPGASVDSPLVVAYDVIDIMAGETFSYLVKSDGTLWGAGSGDIWLGMPNIVRHVFTKIEDHSFFQSCPITYNNGEIIAGTERIQFPNFFSPNNDGVNDVFHFSNFGVIEIEWDVYNRWGKNVFSTSSIKEGWDGRSLDRSECSDGVYYYVVRYKFENYGWQSAKGFLSLLR